MRLRHRMIADNDDARPVLEYNCLRQLLSCTYCLDRKVTSYKATLAHFANEITCLTSSHGKRLLDSSSFIKF